MTITHPAHPRYGEKAEVIRICKGSDPDLIVRFPDGSHSPIFASFTDYFSNTQTTTTNIENQTPLPSISCANEPLPLLELRGLLSLVRFLQQPRVQASASFTFTPSPNPKIENPPEPEEFSPAEVNFSTALISTPTNRLQEGMLEVGSLVNPNEYENEYGNSSALIAEELPYFTKTSLGVEN